MKKKIQKAAVFKAIILGVLIAGGIIYYPYLKAGHIRTFLERNSTLAPVLFIIICALRPIIFYLPSAGLTIVAGLLFGLYRGTLYVCIGGALSTVTGYLFARWMGRGVVERMLSRNSFLARIERFSQQRGWRLVLYMRIFNLPWDMVSYWSGLTGIPFREFYLSSMLVIIPVSFLYTLFGANITRPMSVEFISSLVVIIGLGALPFILRRVQGRQDENWRNNPSGKQDTY